MSNQIFALGCVDVRNKLRDLIRLDSERPSERRTHVCVHCSPHEAALTAACPRSHLIKQT